MPVRRVDPPDDLGAERLRRKDGLDVDANHSPVRTQRGGGIRLGSRNGGRRLHTILGSSEGQPSTRLTEAGYAVSRRVDEGGAGRRSHRRGPRTSTWPSDRPPGHNSGTTMGGYKPVTAADCAGHAQDGSGRREGRSRIPQPQVKRTNPWPRPGVLQSGRRDSNPRPSPWQGRSYCCVRRHLCKQTAFPEQGRCSWAQIPGTKLPPSGPVPVRDACPGRCRHTIVRWEVPDPVLAPTRLTKRRHRGHQPGHQEHQAARLRVPEVRQQPSTLAPPLRHPRGNIDRSHQSDPAKSRISG
jgi:hypothetical protein